MEVKGPESGTESFTLKKYIKVRAVKLGQGHVKYLLFFYILSNFQQKKFDLEKLN